MFPTYELSKKILNVVGLNRLIFCSIPLIYEQFFDGCFFFKHAPFNSLSFGLQATRRIFEFFKKLREFQDSTTINNVQAISVKFFIQQASSCANPVTILRSSYSSQLFAITMPIHQKSLGLGLYMLQRSRLREVS